MAFRPCTQADFERLFNTLVTEDYAHSLRNENEGSGFDVFAAMAAMMGRFEQALNTTQQAYFLKGSSLQTGPQASSGARATGEVVLTRALLPGIGDLDWSLTIPQGTVLEAYYRPDSTGEDLLVAPVRTTEDFTFTAGETGPTAVPVESVYFGYAGNLDADLVDQFQSLEGVTVKGTITTTTSFSRTTSASEVIDRFQSQYVGRYVTFRAIAPDPPLTGPTALRPRRITAVLNEDTIVFDPPLDSVDVAKSTTCEVVELGDIGVTVTQPDPIEGGVEDGLAAIGADRNTGRLVGETDAQYSTRLQLLADVVSPAAIDRICRRQLSAFGIPYEILETRDPAGLGGFVYDASPYDYGQVTPITRVPGSEFPTQGAVYLNESGYRRYFVIVVGFRPLGDFGLFYDATVPFAGTANAYDAVVNTNFYDGRSIVYDQILAQLWNEVNAARAAGVGFVIVVDQSL